MIKTLSVIGACALVALTVTCWSLGRDVAKKSAVVAVLSKDVKQCRAAIAVAREANAELRDQHEKIVENLNIKTARLYETERDAAQAAGKVQFNAGYRYGLITCNRPAVGGGVRAEDDFRRLWLGGSAP